MHMDDDKYLSLALKAENKKAVSHSQPVVSQSIRSVKKVTVMVMVDLTDLADQLRLVLWMQNAN